LVLESWVRMCGTGADEAVRCTPYAGDRVQAAARGCENSIYRNKTLPERTGSCRGAGAWQGSQRAYLPGAHRRAGVSVVGELWRIWVGAVGEGQEVTEEQAGWLART